MSISEKLTTIAENERRVYDAGFADGQLNGDYYDTFWDAFQLNGTRENYTSAFTCAGRGNIWTDDNYNPKYPITIGTASSNGNLMFQNFVGTDTKVPIIYADGLTGFISSVFINSQNLKTIRELHLVEGLTYTIALNNLKALETLNVTGVIGGEGFNVQWSTLLSKVSIKSIINALSTNTTGLTVTLSKIAVNNAFETSEGAADGSTSIEWTTLIGTKQNWTISLVQEVQI